MIEFLAGLVVGLVGGGLVAYFSYGLGARNELVKRLRDDADR